MLNCPFCNFDYSEVGLRDGRCRNCGSVLAWEDEGGSAPVIPPLPTPGSEPPRGPVEASDSDASIPTPQPPAKKSKTEVGAIDATIAHHPTPPEDAKRHVVATMWEDHIPSDANPYQTLKTEVSGPTVSDSVLSIQSRRLRSPDEPVQDQADYELLDIIGRGGVGVVYAARQASIDRRVAVKMLRDELRSRADHRDKFLAEAVVTGDLDHPNIVPIYDLGRSASGELFYSMKNVVGTPWDKVIADKSLAENLEILMKVADAVAFAHSRGVIHRDLKPENIMLGDFGEVLVMDWGIALPTAEFRKSGSISRTQSMGGTPAYMAPEMATGPLDKIGRASDVYLLGAILYEIITGRPPHFGQSVMSCVQAAARNEIQPTQKSGELVDIARKAMSLEPRDRYGSVQQFQVAIREYQSHIESLSLSDRAERDLVRARHGKDYEDFSRAVFAFQEAYSLWSGNERAQRGIQDAKLEYAEAALDKGDYDLGLSLLDRTDPRHESLSRRLLAAQKERDSRQARLKSVKRLVAVLVLGGHIVGVCVTVVIAIQWHLTTVARNQAESLVVQLNDKQGELEDEQQKLQVEYKNVQAAETKAQRERLEAIAQRTRADELRLEAVGQKQRAEESSFFAEISLAGEKLAANYYGVANRILDAQAQSPSKSKLRHWEWGRYHFLSHGGFSDADEPPVVVHETVDSVESLAHSPTQPLVLIGRFDGVAELWDWSGKLPVRTIRHGRVISSVAFSASGEFMATAGSDEERQASVVVWRLDGDAEPQAVQTFQLPASQVRCVAFSNDSDSQWLAAGVDDNTPTKTIRVWDWRRGEQMPPLLGHLANVTSVQFSPDNSLLVSAGEDATVRLWQRVGGREIQRFREHTGAVYAAAFAPNGRQVASAGEDRRVLLWDVQAAEDRMSIVDEVRRRVANEAVPATPYRALEGHMGTIRDLRFSPNGELLISAGHDNTVRVWDVAPAGTGDPLTQQLRSAAFLNDRDKKLLKTLRGHGGWVRSCCFSPDGQFVISGGDDHSCRRWNLATYRELRVLQGHDLPVLTARFSPDGRFVASALADGSVWVWDAESGNQIAPLEEGHDYLTTWARFLPGGKQLLTAAGDNTVRLWDVARGTELTALSGTGRQGVVAMSRDGKWVIAGGDQKMAKLWNLESGRLVHTLNPRTSRDGEQLTSFQPDLPDVTAVAISDDDRWLSTGNSYGRSRIWDAESGQLLHEILGHTRSVTAAFFLPAGAVPDYDDPILVTASSDTTIGQWNVRTGQPRDVPRMRHDVAVNAAALSDDGRRLVSVTAAGKAQTKMWLWNVVNGELLQTSDRPGQWIYSVTFDEVDGNSVLATTMDAESSEPGIWRWNLADDTFTPIGNARMRRGTVASAIRAPDGEHLLTAGGKGARLWHLADGNEAMSYRPAGAVTSLDFSPAGDELIAGASDGTATIWNVGTRKAARKLTGGHMRSVNDAAYSPDGQQIVTAGEDGRLVFWQASDGKRLGEIAPQDASPLRAVVFSPSGEMVLIASADGTASVWDVATQHEVRRFVGHSEEVLCAAFSSNSNWVITGSRDKTVRIWSAITGNAVAILHGHSAPVVAVEFSQDGLRALTGSQDMMAKLWDTRELKTLDPARAALNDKDSSDGYNEILSLNQHDGEITAARFSPNGRHILTASLDHTTIIWPGDYVPPAIALSDSGLQYQIGSGPIHVDRQVVVSEPGRADFDGGRVEVWLEPMADLKEQLSIDDPADQVTMSADEIQYRTDSLSQPQTIGKRLAVDEPNKLVIVFNQSATLPAITTLLRGLTYQCDDDTDRSEGMQRTLLFQLLDSAGKTGNANPESLTIQCIVPDELSSGRIDADS